MTRQKNTLLQHDEFQILEQLQDGQWHSGRSLKCGSDKRTVLKNLLTGNLITCHEFSINGRGPTKSYQIAQRGISALDMRDRALHAPTSPAAIPDDAFIASNDAERLFGPPAGYSTAERDWHAPQTTPDIDCQDDYEFATGTGRYAQHERQGDGAREGGQ